MCTGSKASMLAFCVMMVCGACRDASKSPQTIPREQTHRTGSNSVASSSRSSPEQEVPLSTDGISLDSGPTGDYVDQTAVRIEALLLRHSSAGDPGLLNQAHRLAAQLTETWPGYTYGWFLLAYTERLLGDKEAEGRVLSRAGRDREADYRYFFRRSTDEVNGLFRVHEIMACIRSREGKRPDRPGRDPLVGPVLDGAAVQASTVDCGERDLTSLEPPAYYRVFERITWPARGSDRLARWQSHGKAGVSPEQFARELGIEPGMNVADIGAGIGYFSFPFARVVGDAGMVHAVEIDPLFVDFLEYKIEYDGYTNIDAVRSAPTNINIASESLDVLFLCETFRDVLFASLDFSADDPTSNLLPFLANVRKALKPDGVFILVDSAETEEDDPIDLGRDALKSLVENAGFSLYRSIDDFLPKQAVMIFKTRR